MELVYLFLNPQHPSATIGTGCRIGPSVVIGPDVVIENGMAVLVAVCCVKGAVYYWW